MTENRCPSTTVYEYYDGRLKPDSSTRRCTREEGHPTRWDKDDDMHEWMRPGHAIRWPNR